jgi:hypothetical protein
MQVEGARVPIDALDDISVADLHHCFMFYVSVRQCHASTYKFFPFLFASFPFRLPVFKIQFSPHKTTIEIATHLSSSSYFNSIHKHHYKHDSTMQSYAISIKEVYSRQL